jgi:hypothetical protein
MSEQAKPGARSAVGPSPPRMGLMGPSGEPPLDCLLWTGSRNRKGYGTLGGKLAHRLAWETAVGPIPEGLMVCHRCDVPACVNPEHLFLGTAGDNMRDAQQKGRLAVGERQPQSKLTAEGVQQARALKASAGLGRRRLARRFGVSASVMKRVLSGKDWAHVS